MNKILIRLACAAALLIGSSLQAQWMQTSGPFGADITALAAIGTNLFAGTLGGGVFHSTNGGATWRVASEGLSYRFVTALAVVPDGSGGNILFAGTEDLGSYSSSDTGRSWTPTGAGLGGALIQSFAVNGTTLYAGTNGGIYSSDNLGASWSATGLTTGEVYSIAVRRRVGIPVIVNIYAGTSSGVFLSTDNGANWTSAGLPGETVASLAVNGSSLYAGTSAHGAFLTTNSGSSWAAINTGLTQTGVSALAVNGSNLYAGTFAGGAFHSTDNGANWIAINSGLTNAHVTTLMIRSNGTGGTNLFAGSVDGAFASADSGTNWTAINAGFNNSSIQSLFARSDGSGRILGGTASGSLFFTSDGGDGWTENNSALSGHTVEAFAEVHDGGGTTLFAGTYGEGVFRSTDDGTTWNAANLGLTEPYVLSIAVKPTGVGGTNLYAGTSAGSVFLSTNEGISWAKVRQGLAGAQVSSFAVVGANLFAGIDGEGVYLSTNGGTSWTGVNSGLTDNLITKLAVTPDGAGGNNLFAATASGVFRSTNSGANWTVTGAGLPHTYIFSLVASASELFASTWHGHVYYSSDNGGKWVPADAGLPDIHIAALALCPERAEVFAGTSGSGVYRRPLSEIVGTALTISLSNRWNMVSLPLTVRDSHTAALFPSGISSAFAYQGGAYVVEDTMANRLGYWLRFEGNQTDSLIGFLRNRDTIPVTAGWNMIGSISRPVAVQSVTSIPPSITTSSFYGYRGSYVVSDTIAPGAAYWVKVNQDGQLILDTSPDATSVTRRIRIAATNELPPPAPDESTGGRPASNPDFSLAQNFPNPFNPTTRVSFAIASPSFVTLKIYDLRGEEIAVLVNGREEPGYKTVEWDAGNKAGGVYFYKITAVPANGRPFVKAIKTLLIK